MKVPEGSYSYMQDFTALPLHSVELDSLKSFLFISCDIQNVNWTPSKMINFMGKEINNEESIYYWTHKVRLRID